MKKKNNLKINLLIFSFVLIIVTLRISWIYLFFESHDFTKPGLVQFTEQELEDTHNLDGYWNFYPSKFYSLSDIKKNEINAVPLKVPGNWKDVFDNQPNSSTGYGTYHLTIDAATHTNQSLAFRFSSIRSASKIYINDELLYEAGEVSNTAANYKPYNLPKTITYSPKKEHELIEVIVQVSNFKDNRGGGIVRSVQFGSAIALQQSNTLSVGSQIITISFLYIVSLLSLLLFFVTLKNKALKDFRYAYFSILLFSIATIFFLSSDEKTLHLITNISYEWAFALVNAFQVLAGIVLFKSLSSSNYPFNNKFLSITLWSGRLLIIIAFIIPNLILTTFSPLYSFYLILSFIFTLNWLYLHFKTMNNTNYLFIFAILTMLHHFFWWGYSIFSGLTVPHYPFDLLLTVAFIILIWFKQYIQLFKQLTTANQKLKESIQSKDEFFTVTAQQLTQPLQSLLNINEELMKSELSVQQLERIKQAQTIAAHLTIVINNIKNTIQSQDNKQEILLATVSLIEKINIVQHLITNYFSHQKLNVEQHWPTTHLTVQANQNLLIELLYNIYYFSFKKISHDGKLIISAEEKSVEQGKVVELSFHLMGYRIENEEIAAIDLSYEELIDQHFLLTDDFNIELNFAKKLCLLQKGTFDMTTDQQNTTITLQFLKGEAPFGNEQEVTSEEQLLTSDFNQIDCPLSTEPKEYTQQILIIGQEDIHLDVLQHLLNEQQYHCKVVADEQTASQLIKEEQWDLVIVDPVNPSTNYFAWMRDTRTHLSLIQLPILYLSTWGKLNETHLAFEAGANDYIQKPVDGKELMARVETLTLMKQKVTEAIQLEASWLQSQISPHFLFNTLNTILSLQQIDEERMDEVLDAFMNVLHSKFKYQRATHRIPLAEEIETIQSYVFIEQQRFQDRLEVVYEIETTEQVEILPLTIQPLVENAIRHGILPMQDKGTLVIRVRDFHEFVRIEVADNGAGMTQEEIKSLQKNEFEKTRGIGVVNTNIRLQKEFDSQLYIESELGSGTTFYFDLPKNK